MVDLSPEEIKVLEFIAIYGKASRREISFDLGITIKEAHKLLQKLCFKKILKIFNKKYIIALTGLETINLLKAKK